MCKSKPTDKDSKTKKVQKISAINGINKDFQYIHLKIKNKDVYFLYDTSATNNVITFALVKELGLKKFMKKEEIRLDDFNENRVFTVGSIHLQFRFKNEEASFIFIVSVKDTNVIGLDFMQKFDLLPKISHLMLDKESENF